MTTDSFSSTTLKFGWIWAFTRKLPTWEAKLDESVCHFAKRFGYPPSIGFANPDAFQEEIWGDFSGLTILKSRYILPETILLGVPDDSVFQANASDQPEGRQTTSPDQVPVS